MMNEYIQLYDQLALRRKRRFMYKRIIRYLLWIAALHWIAVLPTEVLQFYNSNDHTWWQIVLRLLWGMILGFVFFFIIFLTLFFVLAFIDILMLQRYILPIINQQDEIHSQIKIACSEISQQMTETLLSSSTVSSSITNVSSTTNMNDVSMKFPNTMTVTFALQVIPHQDAQQGSFMVMDHILIQCSSTQQTVLDKDATEDP